MHGPFTAEFIFHALRPPWAVGLLLLFGLVGYQVITWNDLPRCHELRTKDALSKIISERQGEVSTYDEINTVSELDNETHCTAKVTLSDKRALSINYKLVKESPKNRILVTEFIPVQ